MTSVPQKPQPTKYGKVWNLEEWQLVLRDGEALRLQLRFEKEAKEARPRHQAESDSARRARFEDEFVKARAQVDQQLELRKVAKRKRSPAAVSGDASHFSAVQAFLQDIRRGAVEGLALPVAMARAHGRAAHVTTGGACDACGDAAQALVFALGDANLFPSIRGGAALTAVDKAIVLARSPVPDIQTPRFVNVTVAFQAEA